MPDADYGGSLVRLVALICGASPPPGPLESHPEALAERLQALVRDAVKDGHLALEGLLGSKRINHARQAAGLPPVRPRVVQARLLWALTDVAPVLALPLREAEPPPCGVQPDIDVDVDALCRAPALQRLEALLTTNWHIADKDKLREADHSCLSLADLACWGALQRYLGAVGEADRRRLADVLPFTAGWANRVSQSQLLPPAFPRVLLHTTGRDPSTHHQEGRNATLEGVLDEVDALAEVVVAPDLRDWRAVQPLPIDWGAIPADLDPFQGHVSAPKAARKRLQIENFAALVGAFLAPAPCRTVVEFGAGGGHLGLVLAALFPSTTFVLLELDPKAHAIATARVQRLGLRNVEAVCADAAAFAAPFDLLVGLHCCGSLTDVALAHCRDRRAAFILCPCCYGHAAVPQSGGTPLGEKLAAHWRPLCAAADFSSMSARDAASVIQYDLAHPRYRTAVRCMRAVNLARALRLAETHTCAGHTFSPPACTPKNLCLVGQPLPLRPGR